MLEINPNIIPADLKKYFRPKRKYGPFILRNEIIWHKPNCMPSSVKDRFTVDFEKIFFFVKNKKYWFETQYESSKDPIGTHRGGSLVNAVKEGSKNDKISWHNHGGGIDSLLSTGKRNKRTVWEISTKTFSGAHFAV